MAELLDPLARLLDLIADVPRKTRADRLEALRTAAGEFLRRSLAWRETLPMTAVERNDRDRLAAGATLWRLPAADGRSLAALLEVSPLRRSEWTRLSRPDGVQFVAAWHAPGGNPLLACCAWAPHRGREDGIPDAIFDAWGWAIAQGARARLTGSDAAARDFQRAIEDCRHEADEAQGLNQNALGG